jgi:hypothetical protein
MKFEDFEGNYLLIQVPNSGSLMQFEIIMTQEYDYNLANEILSYFGKRLGFEKKTMMKLSDNPTNPNNVIIGEEK